MNIKHNEVGLKEVKHPHAHYFEDRNGLAQGRYITFYSNGRRRTLANTVDGWFTGEIVEFDGVGNIICHSYRADGEIVHDFKENPISDEEKMLLVLKYGAPLLPKGEIC